MATEIRNRQATGAALTGAPPVMRPEGFQSTSATGIFAEEPDQAYFWTEEWEEDEREADEDIRLGRYTDFDSSQDLMDHLENL